MDSDLDRLTTLIAAYPGIAARARLDVVLQRDDIDVVIVRDSCCEHAAIAGACLAAGKHVLCEKPLTTKTSDATRLISLADEAGLVLMTGHTFLYNAAVIRMRHLLQSNAAGDLYYLYARRTNLGADQRRHERNVGPRMPRRSDFQPPSRHRTDVGKRDRSPGSWHAARGRWIRCSEYPQGVMAHIHVSWADPNKVREIVAVGSEKRIVFNDVDAAEPVRIFDRGVSPMRETAGYGDLWIIVRDGDIVSPRIDMIEPLRTQALHFVECVREGWHGMSGGRSGATL